MGIFDKLNPLDKLSTGGLLGGLFGSSVGGLLGGGTSTAALDKASGQIQDLYKEQLGLAGERGKPFLDVGTGTVGKLGEYMGVSGDPSSSVYGSLLQTYSPDQLTEDPSYNFRLGEGMKGMERAMAAQGKTMSPEAVKALTQYGQDLASTEYGKAFDRYRAGQGDIYDRLMGVSGMGQQEAAMQSGYGMNYASGMGDLLASLASAKTKSSSADSANRSSMFGNLASAGAMAAMAFSDERVKENILKVGEANGFNIYEYNYKGDDVRHRGVLAQEVLGKMPDAVEHTKGGYMKVDYSKIGINRGEL